jgi:hypothetical protein
MNGGELYMESGNNVFMYDGKMVDVTQLTIEQLEDMLGKIDDEIKKLEDELMDCIFKPEEDEE